MDQNILYFIGLLDLDADSYAVDAWLDQDSLVLIAGNDERVQKNFWGGLRFDFWDVVPFGGLGCEVCKAEGRG